MKKYFNLLFIGVLTSLILWSCSRDDDANYTDNDTYSVAYDVSGNFQIKDNEWTLGGEFTRPIPNSDVVMIYQKTDVTSNGNPVWEALPTEFDSSDSNLIPTGGRLRYTYDFTNQDFRVLMKANFDITAHANNSPNFRNVFMNNQTFRIVVVPASFGNNRSNYKKSLNKVMQELNIKSVKVLK